MYPNQTENHSKFYSLQILTYSMEQSPSWEAKWFAASQEIPRIFLELEGSSPHPQASATCPCPGLAQSSPHLSVKHKKYRKHNVKYKC